MAACPLSWRCLFICSILACVLGNCAVCRVPCRVVPDSAFHIQHSTLSRQTVAFSSLTEYARTYTSYLLALPPLRSLCAVEQCASSELDAALYTCVCVWFLSEFQYINIMLVADSTVTLYLPPSPAPVPASLSAIDGSSRAYWLLILRVNLIIPSPFAANLRYLPLCMCSQVCQLQEATPLPLPLPSAFASSLCSSCLTGVGDTHTRISLNLTWTHREITLNMLIAGNWVSHRDINNLKVTEWRT